MSSLPIYALRPPEVLEALAVSSRGLSKPEATSRLGLYGPNALPEPHSRPVWRRLFSQLIHPMALLLWGAGMLALITHKPGLAIVIWSIVVVNAVFSFWQEYRAERAIVTLGKLLPVHARVVRENQEEDLLAAEVVPGDILVLGQGDNIPADARLIEAHGLRVNQAALTGEASAATKSAEASLRDELTELERTNLIFAGTSILAGTCRAVVYSTGALTQFGRIARLSQQTQDTPSALQVELHRLGRTISLIALVFGVAIFFISINDLNIPHIEAFLLAVGVIAAVIPEGLRPTLTLALAIAVQRLARRGVLVKKLSTLETLGRVSVVCTDKSGTLTQNQMTVRSLFVGGRSISVTGVGYEPSGDFSPKPGMADPASDFCMLLKAAYLCNNSRLIPPSVQKPEWCVLGDQTEAALRSLALKGGLDEAEVSYLNPRIHELPFDAMRKRMTTIHRIGNTDTAFVKGAPREVLNCCTSILVDGERRLLDQAMCDTIVAANDAYARGALRVLALAFRELPPRDGAYSADWVERDLVFIGLAAMMDPPRADVAHSMEIFRAAGIRLVMITGDYGLTAESLARRIGMLRQAQHLRILTGADLDSMSDEALMQTLDDEVIFARVAPEHKLRIVDAFQQRGEIVAFSGDGVNDAPALRKADVGIAMGITGTNVAREAADIVLTHDRFGDIATAVEEGRTIYENIRKFLTYILASNIPEIIPFVLTALLGLPLALTVAQILAIDLGTDLLPALALGIESPERETMKVPPSPHRPRLVDGALLWRALWIGGLETVLCYGAFYLVYQLADQAVFVGVPVLSWLDRDFYQGLTPSQVYVVATTVFFAGVVMAQIGSAITSRTERLGVRRLGLFSNGLLWVGIACEVGIALLLIYAPPLANLFGHSPFTMEIWLLLGSFPIFIYFLDRLRKMVSAQRYFGAAGRERNE